MSPWTVWTIYKHPLDYPGKWVMRGWEVSSSGVVPHSSCVVAESLKEVRKSLPADAVSLPGNPDDDPAIYESWLGI